jgi:hypothetical protein
MARRIAGEQPVSASEPVGAAGYTDTGYATTDHVTNDHVTTDHATENRERPWGDRVRWGPLWAGLVTTLATFTLLQLVFVATKAVDIDLGTGDTSFSFWTAVSALIAFFVGGLVAGATTKWDRADDGALHGVLLWALATVALLILGGLSARALAGPLGGFLSSVGGVSGVPAGPQRDAALEVAQDRAAQALISLFLALAASVAGAVAGSKLWPRRHGVDLRDRRSGWGTARA